MFAKLFRRNRSAGIDRLIFDIAEYKKTADYEAFCEVVAGRVFFLHIDPASARGIPRGVPHRIKSTDSLRLATANMQGLTLLPLYTSRDDERLKDSYAEIEGLEALRMVVKGVGVDGLLFQNQGQSWVVLNMAQVRQVLAKRGS